MPRRKRMNISKNAAIGVAWYLPSQWAQLREVSTDREQLEDTYDEWLAMACKKMQELEDAGIVVERVELDVKEWLDWCQEKGLPLDSASRANYVAEKVYQRAKK